MSGIDEPKRNDSPFPEGVPVAPYNYQKPLMKLARQMTRVKPRTTPKKWKKQIKYY